MISFLFLKKRRVALAASTRRSSIGKSTVFRKVRKGDIMKEKRKENKRKKYTLSIDWDGWTIDSHDTQQWIFFHTASVSLSFVQWSEITRRARGELHRSAVKTSSVDFNCYRMSYSCSLWADLCKPEIWNWSLPASKLSDKFGSKRIPGRFQTVRLVHVSIDYLFGWWWKQGCFLIQSLDWQTQETKRWTSF